MPLILAHALPRSVGAVPLTLIITAVFGLFLIVNALGTRRAAVGHDGVDFVPGLAPTADREDVVATGMTGGRVLGLVALIVLAGASVAGPADPAVNGANFFTLTILWGLVGISSMFAGPWWRRVDPLRAVTYLLARAVGDSQQTSVRRLPAAVATWAAVIGLLAWAYLQVFVAESTAVFQMLLLIYVAVHVVGATRYGALWLEQTESLNVLSVGMGQLRPDRSGPITRLSQMPDGRRVRLISATLIAWSLADLIAETQWWHGLGLRSSTVSWVGLLMLLGFTAGIYALMQLTDNGLPLGPAFLAAAGGWVAAHYLSALLVDLAGLEEEPVAALQTMFFTTGHLLAAAVVQRRAALVIRKVSQLSHATFFAQTLIATLLVAGIYLQLGGL